MTLFCALVCLGRAGFFSSLFGAVGKIEELFVKLGEAFDKINETIGDVRTAINQTQLQISGISNNTQSLSEQIHTGFNSTQESIGIVSGGLDAGFNNTNSNLGTVQGTVANLTAQFGDLSFDMLRLLDPLSSVWNSLVGKVKAHSLEFVTVCACLLVLVLCLMSKCAKAHKPKAKALYNKKQRKPTRRF